MKEKNYERVNWQARKTPLSAANLNRMDEGIETNRKAIQEVQSAIYNDSTFQYEIELTVKTRFELPNSPVEGAYYYVESTNTIYQATNKGTYEVAESRVRVINGGGA